MQVVQATEALLDEVAQMFDAYRVFYGQDSDPARARLFVSDRMSRRESVIFVALAEGKGIGFIQLYPSFSSVSTVQIWILNDLYVKPEARRSGAGKALMQHAANWAREHGAARLILETARDNAEAKALYATLGWSLEDAYDRYELEL